MTTNEWLTWIAKKLLSQGPGYLPRRLSYSARKRWADRVFPTRGMVLRASINTPKSAARVSLRDYLSTRPSPLWHWVEADIPSIVRSVPMNCRMRSIDKAEDFLARRFTFRDSGPLTLAPGQWTPGGVGVGWTWDLNRHHWFAVLGFAYWYSGDVRYLRAFVRESSDWMEQHLGRLGQIPWDTPFEVASRINAWLWAHFLFLGSPDWEAAHSDRFIRGLGLQAEYLNQTIEYHSPGNHILLESKALALCAEAFPEFAGAEKWSHKAWRILESELGKQICGDGVHAERSTMYHRIVAGELSELWLFCERNNHPQAHALGEVVRGMAGFQTWIDQLGGAGDPPLFGDAHAEDTYYRFSAPAAVALGSGIAARDLISESTDHGYWLLASEGKGSPRHAPKEALPKGAAFREGGYFVARSGWTADADVLVWDCGPTGYYLNRKHAHLDTLSFTLSVAGVQLLIDPGTNEVDERKDALRSSRAHSTVCIDGQEQGILAERGEIWSSPNAELLLWASSEECTVMAGRHDGYRRLRKPVWHERTIVVMHGLYWLVVDSVTGSGNHLAEQRFHLAPGTQVTADPRGAGFEVTKQDVSLSLHWALDGGFKLSESEATLPRIRVDPSLAELHSGRPEPSWLVTAERRGQVPFRIAVVASSAGRDVRVNWARGSDSLGRLIVTGRDFEHHVSLGRGADQVLTLEGGWVTDANLAINRRFTTEPGDVLIPSGSHVWLRNRECQSDPSESGGAGGMRRILLQPTE